MIFCEQMTPIQPLVLLPVESYHLGLSLQVQPKRCLQGEAPIQTGRKIQSGAAFEIQPRSFSVCAEKTNRESSAQ
jgi:hypothetical protein